mgnify:CR=1 FL=1
MRLLLTAIFLLAATFGMAQEGEYVILETRPDTSEIGEILAQAGVYSFVETNDVMRFWLDNFLNTILAMFVVGWFIPKIFWFSQLSILPRILASTICSSVTMVLIAALLGVYMLSMGKPFGVVIGTAIGDPIGALEFYLLLGVETTVGWILPVIIRIFLLVLRDRKSKEA